MRSQAAGAALLVAVAGCGGSSHSSASSTSTASRPAARTAASATSSTTTHPASTQPSQNARVPATFTIGPDGAVAPAIISVPASFAVALTVVSHDRREHQVVLAATKLTVPAGGRASARIAGLRKGRYPLQLDGAPRGTLLIGVQPGP